MFSIMPEFMLKRIVLSNFPTSSLETEIANSVDFMVEQLELLTQSELAGRLTLNCAPGTLKPGSVTLASEHITILDTIDDIALPENLREEVYKFYPDARVAHLKTGGNFPYLSRADEVNMHLQIHLRRHGLPIQPDASAALTKKKTPPNSPPSRATEHKPTSPILNTSTTDKVSNINDSTTEPFATNGHNNESDNANDDAQETNAEESPVPSKEVGNIASHDDDL